jgi:uncharacterized cupredoxin-like copper-binding protein
MELAIVTDKEHKSRTENLEAELEEVRRQLASNRAATRTGILAFLGVAVAAIVALGITFLVNGIPWTHSPSTPAAGPMHGSAGTSGAMGGAMGSHAAGAGAGAGMMSSGARGSAGTLSAAPGARVVTSRLGEFWVRPNRTSVPAGKVTFVAHNVGQAKHELMVERMPIKMDAPMQPNEDAAQGMIDDMQPGQSGRMTLNLKPGRYMLFCNIPGHYAAGQHTTLMVTR